MPNDVNIKIKAEGAQQTKREIDDVALSAKQIGPAAQEGGTQAEGGLRRIKSSIADLIGPLGIGAIAGAFAKGAMAVAKFFDNVKTRCDEAVENVKGVRNAFGDLFEALGAFDEKQRKAVTKDTYRLLQETSTPESFGIPIINEYARQYKGMVDAGQMSQADYDAGLRGALGYGTLHGGAATKDLIQIMSGWGMASAESQGQFQRMIAAGAEKSGLTDDEFIGALSRGMPTIRGLGWTPQQAIENVAVLASGEAGRKRQSLPAATIEALGAPMGTDLEKYGIPENVAQDPAQLLQWVSMMRGSMDDQSYYRMLQGIYGGEAAAGVLKLVRTPSGSMRSILERAAGPEGAADEAQQLKDYRNTVEGISARSKARQQGEDIQVNEDAVFMKEVRDIGERARDRYRRERPVGQWFDEFATIGEEKEKETAAERLWLESLSEDERRKMREEGYYPQLRWIQMTPEEKFRGLSEIETKREDRPVVVNNIFTGDFINPPGSGNVGPMVDPLNLAN